MEDVLKILLIVGVIFIGIINEATKKKAKTNSSKPQVPPVPKTKPQAGSLTEAWEQIFIPETTPAQVPAKKPASSPSSNKKNNLQREPMKPAKASERTTLTDNRLIAPPPEPLQEPEEKEDFGIHSAEEARRAIILGEILQRKF